METMESAPKESPYEKVKGILLEGKNMRDLDDVIRSHGVSEPEDLRAFGFNLDELKTIGQDKRRHAEVPGALPFLQNISKGSDAAVGLRYELIRQYKKLVTASLGFSEVQSRQALKQPNADLSRQQLKGLVEQFQDESNLKHFKARQKRTISQIPPANKEKIKQYQFSVSVMNQLISRNIEKWFKLYNRKLAP